mmetsp:Transcript_33496/g.75166  ORF Transcript_33496/g.75166 Transcript_33496/m.75166 type:complete len:341 (-) Transcript_33496:2258-3280(-)
MNPRRLQRPSSMLVPLGLILLVVPVLADLEVIHPHRSVLRDPHKRRRVIESDFLKHRANVPVLQQGVAVLHAAVLADDSQQLLRLPGAKPGDELEGVAEDDLLVRGEVDVDPDVVDHVDESSLGVLEPLALVQHPLQLVQVQRQDVLGQADAEPRELSQGVLQLPRQRHGHEAGGGIARELLHAPRRMRVLVRHRLVTKQHVDGAVENAFGLARRDKPLELRLERPALESPSCTDDDHIRPMLVEVRHELAGLVVLERGVDVVAAQGNAEVDGLIAHHLSLLVDHHNLRRLGIAERHDGLGRLGGPVGGAVDIRRDAELVLELDLHQPSHSVLSLPLADL